MYVYNIYIYIMYIYIHNPGVITPIYKWSYGSLLITGRGPRQQDGPQGDILGLCCEKNGWTVRKMDALAKEVSFQP